MKHTIFTICSANYLPTAKVLLDSLAAHEPDSRRVLVLVEREWPAEQRETLAQSLNCEVMPLSALSLPDLDRMAFQYDITEFNTAVKPFVFQTLFNQGSDAVIYLDPDTCLYQPLSALWDVLSRHPAVVTPHITEPLPNDSLLPSTENMARCGQFNFGFVGFANTPKTHRFMDWWAERLTDHCIFHPDHFYFVDQFYGALITSFIPETCIWPHHGYNYAYWNAGQRTLQHSETDGWLTGDGPLVFFHFSGFTRAEPDALSRHQNRVRAEPGSALSQLAHAYAQAIDTNAQAMQPFLQSYSFGTYTDGSPIDQLERRAFRDLSDADKALITAPFDPATRTQLATWQEIDDAGGSPSALLWQVWQERTRRLHTQEVLDATRADAEREIATRTRMYAEEQERLATAMGFLEQERANIVALQEQKQAVEQAVHALEQHIRGLEQALNQAHQGTRELQLSLSYRLGRALTSPVRWARQQTVLRTGYHTARTGMARLNSYRKTYGWRETGKALVKKVQHDGLIGALRTLKPVTPPPQEIAAALGNLPLRRQPAPLTAHTETVDIVVCIHNAPNDVRNCLHSVLRHTAAPYRLILVDDGSQEETAAYVRTFAQEQGVQLIRNEQAKGYTLAANQGLRASTGDYVVLLNSDTIVTPDWLDRMVRCARSSPRIGVVGPVSNTASWQSVPVIFNDEGDWADNPLPEGMSIDDMARLIASVSGCQYPSVGFLNGFCYMIRREVIDTVGVFDEDTFAKGYGEENDYSLRTTAAGWQLAVADDAYVFHAQSRSYSSERRKVLSKLAGEALSRKHGDAAIGAGVELTRASPALAALRARVAIAWEDAAESAFHPAAGNPSGSTGERPDSTAEDSAPDRQENASDRPETSLPATVANAWEGRQVLFLLPVTSSGGGGNVVIQEARALIALGVDARIVNLERHRHWFEFHHPNLGVPVEYIESSAHLAPLLDYADAVVATLYVTVEWIAESFQRRNEQRVRAAYYIQDFEPYFFSKDDPEYTRAWNSYTGLPNLIRITKTHWNHNELLNQRQVDSHVVGCSYDARLFMPQQPKSAGEPVNVIAMVRPSTPRRSPELTLQVLKTLHEKLGDRVHLRFFGVPPDDIHLARMDTAFPHTNLGELSPEGVAAALDGSDIFLDLSTYQAMGLTALEAMACGVAVVAPARGGTGEFLQHEVNGLLVNTQDTQACIDAALRLATDHALRTRLSQAALAEAPRHSAARSARRVANALFNREPVHA